MSITASVPLISVREKSSLVQVLEKYFYLFMSVFIAVVVFYGFSHTVNKNLIHPEVQRPWILWVHGIVFSSWLLFFIMQSALVRARSVRALGERHTASAKSKIRDRLTDNDEWPEVRAEAARALGQLCDVDSADVLLAFAKVLADPMASPNAQLIGSGALMSLGRLAQPNLPQQLAPLTNKKAPPTARRAAAIALATRDRCVSAAKR